MSSNFGDGEGLFGPVGGPPTKYTISRSEYMVEAIPDSGPGSSVTWDDTPYDVARREEWEAFVRAPCKSTFEPEYPIDWDLVNIGYQERAFYVMTYYAGRWLCSSYGAPWGSFLTVRQNCKEQQFLYPYTIEGVFKLRASLLWLGFEREPQTTYEWEVYWADREIADEMPGANVEYNRVALP